MNPARVILALHEAWPGVDFAEAMEAHLLLGYVFATPEAMAMARRIRPDSDPGNPWDTHQDGTTLYVWSASGDIDALAAFLASIPNCNAVAYHRRGRLICRATTQFLHALTSKRRRQSRGTVPQAVRSAIQGSDEADAAPTESAEGVAHADAGAHGPCCDPSEF